MNGLQPVRIVGPLLWREAIERLLTAMPNVSMVLDQDLPEANSVTLLLGLTSPEVQKYLQRCGSHRCILVTNETEMRSPLFQKANITVFVGQQEETEVLLDAIGRAALNEAYCSPSLIAALISTAQTSRGEVEPVAALSPLLAKLSLREREVVSFVLEGWSNDKIAAHLHVSLSTVKFHLFHAYRKLGISRRAELRTIASQQQSTNNITE